MALLDDLKQEAERIRADGEHNRSSMARNEAFYRKKIKPALLRVLDYQIELLAQLKVIQPEIRGEFEIPGLQQSLQLQQSLPTVSVDSRDHITSTGLSLEYAHDQLEFSVSPREAAEETRAFLDLQRQQFSDWPLRAADGSVSGLHFSVSSFRVPAFIELSADIDNQRITFTSTNLRGYHQQVDYLHPDVIDDAWLDNLGRYLLDQGPNPFVHRLDEAKREEIRRRLAAEKIQREQELATAERAASAAAEEHRLSVRMRRLLGKVKQRVEAVKKR